MKEERCDICKFCNVWCNNQHSQEYRQNRVGKEVCPHYIHYTR